jgi:hypothetical protein
MALNTSIGYKRFPNRVRATRMPVLASEVAASLIVAVGDDSYLQDLLKRHDVAGELIRAPKVV